MRRRRSRHLLALPDGAVFQGWLPAPLDRAAAALLWVWFVNLYNFMDGIDGIAGSETASIGIGLALFAVDRASATTRRSPPLPARRASPPPRSGFWSGTGPRRASFSAMSAACRSAICSAFCCSPQLPRGHWKIALILPLYFLADATITLLRRLMRGERVWLPHREHFYQQAVRRGLGHAAVVRRVIAADVVLIGCAWIAETVSGALGLAVAAATVLRAAGEPCRRGPPRLYRARSGRRRPANERRPHIERMRVARSP